MAKKRSNYKDGDNERPEFFDCAPEWEDYAFTESDF